MCYMYESADNDPPINSLAVEHTHTGTEAGNWE